MCGIAGVFKNNILNRDEFETQLLKMQHRGPDSKGVINIPKWNAFLGHVRLSIIDTSNAGLQPMSDNSGRYILVFNGEIYNYKTLRTILMDAGAEFSTQSDSEVLLEAYKFYGEKMLDHLEGMFAFSILDKELGTVFMARDRFGVKPFYYSHTEKGFYFSSEIKVIKGLLPEVKINELAKYNYFKTGYIPTTLTIFEDIIPLMPGYFGLLSLENNQFKTEKYWSNSEINSTVRKQLSREEISNNIESLLKRSFELRMVADVPVGVFLSGGIDSSLLAAILKKGLGYNFMTFTIGFDNDVYDESVIAKEISQYLGLKNIHKICTYSDFKNQFERMYEYFDEPFSDSSAPLTMLVSELAKKHVTVSLSADGGDEFFGGYSKYYSNKFLYNSMLRMPNIVGNLVNPMLSKLIGIRGEAGDLEKISLMEMGVNLLKGGSKYQKRTSKIEGAIITDWEIENFLPSIKRLRRENNGNFQKDNLNLNITETLMLHDINNYMVGDILKKVDMATMSKSLEGREPFLDHHLLAFLASLKPVDKFYGGNNKPILRELVYKYIPKEMIDKPKKGFGAPLKEWSGQLIEEYKDFLYESFKKQGWSISYLELLLLKSGQSTVMMQKLWTILNYLLWEKKFT